MDLDEVLKMILKDYVSNDFRCVNYSKLKDLKFWRAYMEGNTVRLKEKNICQESECFRKTFFINLYNLMCIYAVCVEGTLNREVSKIKDFFGQNVCLVDGEMFSLDDILHGVLRANSPHPASKTPYFGSNIPKRKFCLKTIDPRILFAINSADMSSPPIRYYSSSNIDKELDAAVADVCASEVSWNPVGRTIVVPRLLLWYRRDFPGGHDVATVRWVARYLNPSARTSLDVLLDELEFTGGVRIIHDSHDWRLNHLHNESAHWR